MSKVESAVLTQSATNKSQGKNGAFITGCHEHCGQWAQGQQAGANSDFNATIDHTTAPFVVQAWYLHNKKAAAAAAAGGQPPAPAATSSSSTQPFVHMVTAEYPCADCCDGGDGTWWWGAEGE